MVFAATQPWLWAVPAARLCWARPAKRMKVASKIWHCWRRVKTSGLQERTACSVPGCRDTKSSEGREPARGNSFTEITTGNEQKPRQRGLSPSDGRDRAARSPAASSGAAAIKRCLLHRALPPQHQAKGCSACQEKPGVSLSPSLPPETYWETPMVKTNKQTKRLTQIERSFLIRLRPLCLRGALQGAQRELGALILGVFRRGGPRERRRHLLEDRGPWLREAFGETRGGFDGFVDGAVGRALAALAERQERGPRGARRAVLGRAGFLDEGGRHGAAVGFALLLHQFVEQVDGGPAALRLGHAELPQVRASVAGEAFAGFEAGAAHLACREVLGCSWRKKERESRLVTATRCHRGRFYCPEPSSHTSRLSAYPWGSQELTREGRGELQEDKARRSCAQLCRSPCSRLAGTLLDVILKALPVAHQSLAGSKSWR